MIKPPNMSEEEKKKILEELLNDNSQTSNVNEGIIDFNDLIWEPKAYREPNASDKKLFYFNESQERLVKADFDRHPSSNEFFNFICLYLDDQKNNTNVLNQEQTEIAKDMLDSYGEFFCQAMKTEQNDSNKKLIIYELVNALPRNKQNNGYDETGLKYFGQVKEFDISDLELGEYHYYKNIHENHDNLIIYTHSRTFDNLPEEIKENGGIYLLNPGKVRPVGRGSYGRFDVDSYYDRASRGVRKKFSIGIKG